MRSFFALASLMALAGRALALDIIVGGVIGNLTALSMLNVSDSVLVTRCQAQCDSATTAIHACVDDNCLCDNTTVTAIVACEQCMFDVVIATNNPKPDPKAGSTPVLAAYSAACQESVNVTLAPTAIGLTLPADWNGPVTLSLNIPATIVTVGIGAILGSGAFFILNSM